MQDTSVVNGNVQHLVHLNNVVAQQTKTIHLVFQDDSLSTYIYTSTEVKRDVFPFGGQIYVRTVSRRLKMEHFQNSIYIKRSLLLLRHQQARLIFSGQTTIDYP
jgi:hypothetical protein